MGHIDLGNATFDELEKLTQACEPTNFGLNQEDVLDETYRKAGKLDPESFSLMLDLSQTNLQKIIGDYLLETSLESTQRQISDRAIQAKRLQYAYNLHSLPFDAMFLPR